MNNKVAIDTQPRGFRSRCTASSWLGWQCASLVTMAWAVARSLSPREDIMLSRRVLLLQLLVTLVWPATSMIEAVGANITTTVWYYPDYKETVCQEADHGRRVTDAWSANSLVFLRVNESDAGDKLIVFDVQIRKYYKLPITPRLEHYIQSVQRNDSSCALDLVQANLLKTIIERAIAPSVLYFEPRTMLRISCHNEWFYDPADSKFCRRHPLVTDMDRVLVVLDNELLAKPEKHQFQVLHTHRLRADDFGETIYRPVTRRSMLEIRDLLRQFITASVLLLQVNNKQAAAPAVPVEQQTSRYHFSNRLGLFVSWPTTPGEHEHCAVLLTVKLQPHIRLCTRKASIVSFLEYDSALLVVLADNKLVRLSHLYLKKQFRIFNNFDIDLDGFEAQDIFDSIFHCKDDHNGGASADETATGIEVTTKPSFLDVLKG